MTEQIKEMLDDIKVEQANDRVHQHLEDGLCEIEMTVDDLEDALSALRAFETYPDHVSRKDEHTIDASREQLEEIHRQYVDLLEEVEAKFQAVDEQLYGDTNN